MSASLVGSEMCIRDRAYAACLKAGASTRAACSRECEASAHASFRVAPFAGSPRARGARS
eukprot:15184302-Alexandrium_andersonii.AAC.1